MRSACAALVLITVATTLALAKNGADEHAMIEGVPVTTLVEHLRGDDPAQRRSALLLVSNAGARAAAAVPALTELLNSGDATVRAMAANALGGMGAAASSAAAKLQFLADNDPDATVRGYAQFALMDVGAAAGGLQVMPDPIPQVPEPTLPAADPGVTAYLQPLRDHKAKLAEIGARINALQATQPQDNAEARKWAQDLQRAGNDLIAEGRAFKATLHAFVTSRTRRGLTEELDLVNQCMAQTDSAATSIRTRTNFDLQAYAARRDLRQAAAARRSEILGFLAQKVDERIEAEGLLALLATDGIAAVRNEAVSRLRTEAETELDRITQQELGIAFHDASSFRSAVRSRGRDLVRRQVGKLLVKITSNQIVVELLAAPIIAWIEGDLWPKLKEAFRNKGDLEFRTKRSTDSLERARMRLWALPPDATLDTVRAALRNAEGARNATRYLVGDLNRANRADLFADLDGAAGELNRAISITGQRFLLHKLEALEKVEPQEDVYRALLAMIEAMVRDIEIPA